MAQLFFYCSNDAGVWIDRRLAPAGSLTEAMEQATKVVRSLVDRKSTRLNSSHRR